MYRVSVQGGYAGNALGFKVASLTKLMDTRANKPRVTLLHHLVEEAQQEAKDVLDFAGQLQPVLSEASRCWVPTPIVVNVLKDNNKVLKGTFRDYYNLLTAPRAVSNTSAQVARAQLCAHHAQHVERVSP